MGPVYLSTAQPQFPTRKLHGKKRRKWQACLSGAVFRRARKENLPAPMEDSPRGTHQGSDSCSWWQKWLTFATPSTPFWFLWCLFLYKEGNKRHVKRGKEKVYFMALLFFSEKKENTLSALSPSTQCLFVQSQYPQLTSVSGFMAPANVLSLLYSGRTTLIKWAQCHQQDR